MIPVDTVQEETWIERDSLLVLKFGVWPTKRALIDVMRSLFSAQCSNLTNCALEQVLKMV